MDYPKYNLYSMSELQEALDGINKEAYPARFEEIKRNIANRKEQGFVLTAKTLKERLLPSIPTNTVALPLLWSLVLRVLVMNLIFGMPVGIFLTILSSFVLSQNVYMAISIATITILNFSVMILAIKQMLSGSYKHFYLELCLKK